MPEVLKTSRVRSRDVARMVEMIVEGIRPYVSTPLLGYAKRKSMSSSKNNFLIVREEGRIVAFLAYRIEAQDCVIFEIHVDKEHRGKGLGSKLMEELLRAERERSLVLLVHRNNSRAQSFYERNGFRRTRELVHRNCFEMVRDR